MYQYSRLLSLDVALGSVAGASLAAYICGTLGRMPWSWWLLLPLIVWLIYTADHLLDARRIGPDAAAPRHQFHYRHFRVLASLLLLGSIVAGVVILLYLPRPLLYVGLGLGAAALLHLCFAQWTAFRRYPAEAIIALLYTAGVWFGPLLTPPGVPRGIGPEALRSSLVLFFLSAFTNLVVFSLFERETDARESPNTIVAMLGVKKSEGLLYTGLIVSLAISGALLRRSGESVSFWLVLLLFCVANVPLAVYATRGFFARDERYRAVCDGVFIAYALPALVALVALVD